MPVDEDSAGAVVDGDRQPPSPRCNDGGAGCLSFDSDKPEGFVVTGIGDDVGRALDTGEVLRWAGCKESNEGVDAEVPCEVFKFSGSCETVS